MFKTKSVHSPAEPADGLRLLVTRFRGRGLPDKTSISPAISPSVGEPKTRPFLLP